MESTFGKHKGKSSEEILLKHFSYVKWVLSEKQANRNLLALKTDFEQLIKKFDEKPFLEKCYGCSETATRVSACVGRDENLFPWCDHCDPYGAGVADGKPRVLRTVNQVRTHVEFTCKDSNSSYDRLLRAFANTKGSPARLTVGAAKKFFE